MNNFIFKTMPFKKGYKMSEEHKKKIGLANEGRKPSLLAIEKSKEARKNLIPWNKGKKTGLVPWNKGIKTGLSPWNKGKRCLQLSGKRKAMSQETKQKISRALIKLERTGELAPRWNNNATRTNDDLRHMKSIKIWKKTILERDDFACQNCKISGGDLVVHHINNFAEFPELRTSLDNGIVLCRICHRFFHKTYGYTSNTREQLNEFLTLAGAYE